MALKRTRHPYYTKSMQRLLAAAHRSGDTPLILQATAAVQQVLKARKEAAR